MEGLEDQEAKTLAFKHDMEKAYLKRYQEELVESLEFNPKQDFEVLFKKLDELQERAEAGPELEGLQTSRQEIYEEMKRALALSDQEDWTLTKLLKLVEHRDNAILLGKDPEARHQLLADLKAEIKDREVFLADAKEVSSAAEFLELVRTLMKAPEPDYPDWVLPDYKTHYLLSAIGQGLPEYKRGAQELWPLVIVENLDPVLCHTLFCRMRDMLWEYPIHWILSGEEEFLDSHYLLPPPDFWRYIVNCETGLQHGAVGKIR